MVFSDCKAYNKTTLDAYKTTLDATTNSPDTSTSILAIEPAYVKVTSSNKKSNVLNEVLLKN